MLSRLVGSVTHGKPFVGSPPPANRSENLADNVTHADPHTDMHARRDYLAYNDTLRWMGVSKLVESMLEPTRCSFA